MINYLSKPFKWFFKLEAASGLVLLFAAIAALIISNSNFAELYSNLGVTLEELGKTYCCALLGLVSTNGLELFSVSG